MRMLAEMATALPRVRTFTDFARAGLGDGAGFAVGWLYWYFWVLVVPVEAIAGAKILQTWIPLPPLPIGLALMSVMTGVNLMSTRSYAEFEFWFASVKVAAILVFIVVAASYAFGWTSPDGPTFHNLVTNSGFAPHGWVAVVATVPTVFFAMTGAEITMIAAAESAQPGLAVARLSSAVIGRILLFYVGSVFLIVCVVSWSAVRGGESPFTLALTTMHIPGAALIMKAIILTAVLSCMNSAFYVSSRVLFVLADRGDAPPSLVRLNARRVPVFSVLMGATAGFLGIIAATQAPQVTGRHASALSLQLPGIAQTGLAAERRLGGGIACRGGGARHRLGSDPDQPRLGRRCDSRTACYRRRSCRGFRPPWARNRGRRGPGAPWPARIQKSGVSYRKHLSEPS